MNPSSFSRIPHDVRSALREVFLRGSLSFAYAFFLRLEVQVTWPHPPDPQGRFFVLLRLRMDWKDEETWRLQWEVLPLSSSTLEALSSETQAQQQACLLEERLLREDAGEVLWPYSTRLFQSKVFLRVLGRLATLQRTEAWLVCPSCPTWTARAFRDLAERLSSDSSPLAPFRLAAPLAPSAGFSKKENPFRLLGMQAAKTLTHELSQRGYLSREEGEVRLLGFRGEGSLLFDEAFEVEEGPIRASSPRVDPFGKKGSVAFLEEFTSYRMHGGLALALLVTADGWRMFEPTPTAWHPWPMTLAPLSWERRLHQTLEDALW